VPSFGGELRLAASPNDIAGAADCFRRAIDIAVDRHARSWELRVASSLARLFAADRWGDEGRRALAGVHG
jgi:hypothetical protein